MASVNLTEGSATTARGLPAREPRTGRGRPDRRNRCLTDPSVDLAWPAHRAPRAGLVTLRNHVVGFSTLSALQISRHFPWMIPLANLVLFVGWGLFVVLLGRVWRRVRGEASVFLLCFPACLAPLLVFPGLYRIAYLAVAAALATRVTRRISAGPDRFSRLVTASLPFLLLGSCLFAGWKGSQIALGEQWAIAALPRPTSGGMNILLLVMDTVRADRLSLHGYGRDTSPNLRRVAAKGVRFDQGASDRALDASITCEHVNGIVAASDRRVRESSPRPGLPDPGRIPGQPWLSHGRVRREYVLLQFLVRPGTRFFPL